MRKGIVYRSTGSWYLVKDSNGDYFNCRIKGKFRSKGIKSTNPITVGDEVDFDITDKNDKADIIDIAQTTVQHCLHIVFSIVFSIALALL